MNPFRPGLLLFAAAFFLSPNRIHAAVEVDSDPVRAPLPQALTEADTKRVTLAVDRALQWLAVQADRDGAFTGNSASTNQTNGGTRLQLGAQSAFAGGSRTNGQPALTSLSIMAFLSRGHRPGVGPYGETLSRAIDFTLSCQKPSGLICYGYYDQDRASNASDTYNHAITMLMLGEVYGMTIGERAIRVRQAIEKGLAFTHGLWITPKNPQETGGWRYLHQRFQSDLSVTGWYVASLRSIKNAGFDVPKEVMDRTSEYVVQCYSEPGRTFTYRGPLQPRPSVAMTGAGILSLALAGKPNHPCAIAAAQTLSQDKFYVGMQRCYYACYYATQAAAQMAGETWRTVYRNVATFLLPIQTETGQWPLIDQPEYGPVYSTSLAILSLTPYFQLLPIYQH